MGEIFRLFYDIEKRSQKEEEPRLLSEERRERRPRQGRWKGKPESPSTKNSSRKQPRTAWITRIPYQKDTYVCLPKEACRLLPGEEILEVYLKDEQTYRLKNR